MLVPDFSQVNLIPRSHWYVPNYLERTRPGDLLLLGEMDHGTGGIIRIRKTSVFLSLTPGQVWERHPVLWPRPEDGIGGFVIEGRDVVFFPQSSQGESSSLTT